jgi:hypothetical protein
MATLPTFLTADELALVLRCQPEKVYRLGPCPTTWCKSGRVILSVWW